MSRAAGTGMGERKLDGGEPAVTVNFVAREILWMVLETGKRGGLPAARRFNSEGRELQLCFKELQ